MNVRHLSGRVSLEGSPCRQLDSDSLAHIARRIELLELAIVGQGALAHAVAAGPNHPCGEPTYDDSIAPMAGIFDPGQRAPTCDGLLPDAEQEHSTGSVQSCSNPTAGKVDRKDSPVLAVTTDDAVDSSEQDSEASGGASQRGRGRSTGEISATAKNVSSIETFVSTNDAMDMITSQIERTIAVCEGEFACERESLYLKLEQAENNVLKERERALKHSALISDLTRRVETICAESPEIDQAPDPPTCSKTVTFAENSSVFDSEFPAGDNEPVSMTSRAVTSLRETLVAKGQSLQSLWYFRRSAASSSSSSPRQRLRSPHLDSLVSPRRSPRRSPSRTISSNRLEQGRDLKPTFLIGEDETHKAGRASGVPSRSDSLSNLGFSSNVPRVDSRSSNNENKFDEGEKKNSESEGHTMDADSSSSRTFDTVTSPRSRDASILSSEVRAEDFRSSLDGMINCDDGYLMGSPKKDQLHRKSHVNPATVADFVG